MHRYTVYLAIAIILIIIVCTYKFTHNRLQNNRKKNNLFYNVNDISAHLSSISLYKDDIYREVMEIYRPSDKRSPDDQPSSNQPSDRWMDWPEKDLYAESGTWKIFPFYGFNVWNESACAACPVLSKYLHSISGLKLATLSILSPGMRLQPHQGWASHSNHVIRCHYGLSVQPSTCYMEVSDRINGKPRSGRQYHEQFKWLIFDDSKTHYAINTSDADRIILIVDIERPANIRVGESEIGDSKELTDIIDYFKSNDVI
jgi:hypothetical protein